MTLAANGARFITVEGGEGVGKSTQIEHIRRLFAQRDVPLCLTREPGGTPLAEDIRAILLDDNNEAMCEKTELLLVFAARAQHLEQVIKPALAAGQWVLCDRFTDATYAYQGGGRGLSMSLISELERQVQGDLRPDYSLLLDASADVGLARAKARAQLDRFEQEDRAFFDRVRQVYLDRAKAEPQRFELIDASASLEQVSASVTEVVNRWWES